MNLWASAISDFSLGQRAVTGAMHRIIKYRLYANPKQRMMLDTHLMLCRERGSSECKNKRGRREAGLFVFGSTLAPLISLVSRGENKEDCSTLRPDRKSERHDFPRKEAGTLRSK